MSRKHRARNSDPAAAVTASPVDTCEHVDDDNNGVCDLCGVEVEIETGNDEPTPLAPPVIDPSLLQDPLSGRPKKYYVREGVGCPFFNGRSYKPGEEMPLTEADSPRWKKFVDVR